MTKISLHGLLAKQVGQEFYFSRINSIFDAVRFLELKNPNLRSLISKQVEKGFDYEFIVNGSKLKKEEVGKVTKFETIDIVPCVSGKDPTVFLISLMVNLMVAGITYLLTPVQEIEVGDIEASVEAKSFYFANIMNGANQGRTVPVGYGRLRVGSEIISANVSAKINLERANYGNKTVYLDRQYANKGPRWRDRF